MEEIAHKAAQICAAGDSLRTMYQQADSALDRAVCTLHALILSLRAQSLLDEVVQDARLPNQIAHLARPPFQPVSATDDSGYTQHALILAPGVLIVLPDEGSTSVPKMMVSDGWALGVQELRVDEVHRVGIDPREAQLAIEQYVFAYHQARAGDLASHSLH